MRKYNLDGLKLGLILNIKNRKPSNQLVCPICKKEFKRRGKRKNSAKLVCCSKKCKADSQKGKLQNRTVLPRGKLIICKICGNTKYRYPSQLLLSKYCSQKCKNKDDEFWNHTRGKNHYNWKGGVSPINQIERKCKKYYEWRTSVFRRDKFTCQKCGYKGNGLQAHHIRRWSKYKNLRFEINNGKTLCKPCHKKHHKPKKNTRRKRGGFIKQQMELKFPE